MSALEFQHAAVSDFAASELAGVLDLDPFYAAFTASDLVDAVRNAGETLRDTQFTIGDAALCYIARAGSLPSDRAKALQELGELAYVQQRDLRQAVRVARAFPPEERAEYAGQPKSWFVALTERTALPGDAPEDRRDRRRALARECADMNTRETREHIEATLRQSNGRGSFLEMDDEPAPLPPCPVLEVPTHEAPDLVERFTKGLEKRLIHEAPGPWSDIACVVRMFLIERVAQGWRLEAPR